MDKMMAVHACENENCLARFEAELDPVTLGSERACPACGNSGFAGAFWAYPEGCLRPEDEPSRWKKGKP